MKLSEICVAINGVLNDSEDRSVHRLSTPEDACQESLVLCLKDKWVQRTIEAQPRAVVTLPGLADRFPHQIATIVIADPPSALTGLLKLFAAPTAVPASIHPTAVVDPTASIHSTVSIGPHCVVGPYSTLAANVRVFAGSVIGERVDVGVKSIIYPNAVLMDDVSIGAHSIVGPGAIIGYEGFSIDQGEIRPHLGTVVIGEHSSVGANSCVDRGTIGKTQLGAHTHTDNLVQIGHNAKIGDHVLLCGQVGVSGSVTIGDHVMIGGQAGIKHGADVSPNVMVAAQSGVTKDLKQPGQYSGHPAEPNQQRLRRMASLKRLVKDKDV